MKKKEIPKSCDCRNCKNAGEVKDFDKCRWNEYSTGIHFFIDRNMAVVYGSNLLGIKNINLYLK